ncbi:hypothetical protein HTV45_33835, partial [Streptomyces sp. CHD11]|nr:hypothetical protein [Streptomyces sp. CHD11]
TERGGPALPTASGCRLAFVAGLAWASEVLTTEARDAFVDSVSSTIDTYGLDGLDIDFEAHSLSLDDADAGIENPTTPVIVHLISALRTLKERYGDDFTLTM